MAVAEAFDHCDDADLAALRRCEQHDARSFATRAAVEARLLQAASAKEDGWAGSAPWPGVVLEVAGTARVSQWVAESRLEDSRHLVENLPGTHAALAAGQLFVPQGRVLIAETRTLTAKVCAEVERRILPIASSCAPADLRRRVRRAVLSADPAGAEQAHEDAAQGRAVWVRPIERGMAVLGAVLTAVQGRRFDTGLSAVLGRTVVPEGDDRTVEQRRADLLADLPDLALELLDLRNGLLPPAGIPSLVGQYLPDTPRPTGRLARRRRRRTQVIVQVPVCTAVGLSDEPVWLDGHGWITARQGLALLPEAELRKACIDPRSGRLLAVEDPVVPGQQTRPANTDTDSDGARGPDRREFSRPPPPDRDQVAAAIHAALLKMATEPTIVEPDDPSLRVEPQHDPSDPLREFVDLRDGGCDGIGCSVAPTVCDQDHERPWPAGATRARGLRNRSRRCHGAKHNGWTVAVDNLGWSTWTSPGGRSYQRPPRHEPPPPPPEPGRRPRHVLRQAAREPRPDDNSGDSDGTGIAAPSTT